MLKAVFEVRGGGTLARVRWVVLAALRCLSSTAYGKRGANILRGSRWLIERRLVYRAPSRRAMRCPLRSKAQTLYGIEITKRQGFGDAQATRVRSEEWPGFLGSYCYNCYAQQGKSAKPRLVSITTLGAVPSELCNSQWLYRYNCTHNKAKVSYHHAWCCCLSGRV